MAAEILIAGGGIGGLAAALACARAQCRVRVLEQAAAFSEVGAGIQLGPNATRLLWRWGLERDTLRVAAAPAQLRVRSAASGEEVASMALGDEFLRRYGSPYLTIHRADLQDLLLRAAQQAEVGLELNARVSRAEDRGESIAALAGGRELSADALVAADGVWSRLRAQVAGDAAARATGHLAYRALAPLASLPQQLRTADVTVWLGPRMHVVCYPVRGGEFLNVVAIVESSLRGALPQDWDQRGTAADLRQAMGPVDAVLQALIEALPGWRLWALHDRDPVASAREMARGRIALLGDAAHPMLPYLAQGAGMAIEDAAELGGQLQGGDARAIPAALQRYADSRWKRCARVQAHARRNAFIFHAGGLVQWGRDLSLRLLGERLLDQPWLYGR
ncbi:FAD-dependent monooxygenase [Ramlibacter tataouinensis]|uniref:FAD-dependent oxidoreductase n=1 Tax=Ramlibacter tataouinensis TaxID=94132 RepID=A0A127JPV2_9BURK|nr:FAD-dependent monooxygenase [Ramlibacter tataouinensis]AMO22046.1 FAD-dependent oxidoreductase [Ramlibacter tataouinensis]